LPEQALFNQIHIAEKEKKMGEVISGMEAVYKPCLLLGEISLVVFAFMFFFLVLYMILGKI
jgi:hypothetical protein